jgi:hypothetical protein
MGTPHSISDEEKKWRNVALLPHVAGLSFKAPIMGREDIKKLSQSSLAFDQGGVICPILTMCETRETKLKKAIGSKRIKVSPNCHL